MPATARPSASCARGSAGIDLGFEGDGPLFVRGEPLLLGELVGNLVENAIAYAGANVATVRTCRDGGVVFEIEDDGRGLTGEEMARVRRRFSRGASTARGTGLGLPIVEEIAELFGGTLSLSAGAGGKGLKVRVRFPELEPTGFGNLSGRQPDDEVTAQRSCGRIELVELCSVVGIQYTARLVFRDAHSARKLRLRNAGLAPGQNHGNLCQNLCRQEHDAFALGGPTRRRQRQTFLQIGQRHDLQGILGKVCGFFGVAGSQQFGKVAAADNNLITVRDERERIRSRRHVTHLVFETLHLMSRTERPSCLRQRSILPGLRSL